MLTVNGSQALSAELHVPRIGPWFCDVDLAGDDAIADPVVLRQLGSDGSTTAELRGVVDPEASGIFGLQHKLRILAGAGGWRRVLKARPYQNDLGVVAATVARDAAREAGETFAALQPAAERLRAYYTRAAGTAAAALEAAAGGAPWWVGFDGQTRVGARATVVAPADTYTVLSANLRERTANLSVDKLDAIVIGSQITHESTTGVVGAYTVRITPDSMRVHAWIGDTDRDRLADNLLGIISAAARGSISGKWRYRVLGMAGDRVSCQAVRKDAGLPDLVNVEMWPGIAGAHAELTPGAEVLIEFVEEDPQQPVITAFGGRGRPGFVPVVLHLADGDAPVARIGDTVNFFFPPAAPISGIIAPDVPFSGVITLTSPGVGIIQTGNAKVRA